MIKDGAVKMILAAGVALVVGLGIGAVAAGSPTSQEQAKAVPGPTVTKQVEVPGPTVAKTPKACIAALDAAERVVGHTQEAFNIAADMVALLPDVADAAGALDVEAMNEITVKIEKANGNADRVASQIEEDATTYRQQAAQCRASR